MKRSGFLFPLFLTTLTLATLTWIGCSSAPPPVKENKIREFPDSRSGAITEAQARARAQQIRAVSYQLWFAFGKSAQSFEGRTTLRFELTENASSIASQLPVDFEEGEILGIKINHRTSTDHQRDSHRLWFSLSDLNPGYNEIEIHYRQKPTTTGNGLVRYKDPADEEVYVFTNLEPAYARRVFPCFDQPDLKASFELTVHTPENWAVIANTREIYAPRVDGKRSWQFPPSPRMSTYLFSLAAGPFAFWKSESHGVPLSVFYPPISI